MIVRELVTRLGFEADNREAKKFDTSLRNVRRVALGVTAAVGAAQAALFGFANSVARGGDEIDKTSERLGLTTTELQEYRFAAKRSGVTTQTLEMALQRMGRRIGEAAKGTGEAQDALKEMDISATAADGSVRSISDLMPEVADKLGAMENANRRNALAMKLFDSEGVRLVQMLEGGSEGLSRMREEFQRLGGEMGGDLIDDSVEYTDAMTDLRTAANGVKFMLGSQLIPALTRTIQTMTDWIAANRDWIASGLGDAIAVVRRITEAFWFTVRAILTPIHRVIEATVGWERVLKILSIMFGIIIALKMARWIWGVVGAIRAAVAATGAWRLALLLLQRVKIVALMVALAIAIEDVITWIRGGDSALGSWLGSWEDFKDKVGGWIDSIKKKIREIGEAISDAIPEWVRDGLSAGAGAIGSGVDAIGEGAGRAADALGSGVSTAAGAVGDFFTGGSDPEEDTRRMGSGRRIEVNARTEATLQVPQGTSQEQQAALQSQVDRIFSEHWDREMRRALADFPATE